VRYLSLLNVLKSENDSKPELMYKNSKITPLVVQVAAGILNAEQMKVVLAINKSDNEFDAMVQRAISAGYYRAIK
jgi:hypothetical protein